MSVTSPSPLPTTAQQAARGANQAVLLAGLVIAALLALYAPTVTSIVAMWDSSETFAHGYVILPISLWLVWRRRACFAQYPAQPWWPALLGLALAGVGWLVARMGEVQVVMQYAFAAMLPLAALAMFGVALARALAFPLLFILFAVPFGEVFIDPLISFTADFTVAALQMIGMPVLRSGTRFEIPTGSWSVVEACSGVRYLISSITLGCLYAYLTYTTWPRRLMFVAVSIIVPVVANGLRAFMIVMIGHYSGMTLAVGVDHLIYGWLFFGLVMLLMFWVGGFWRQDDLPASASASASGVKAAAGHGASAASATAMAAAVLALAAAWPALALWSDKANFNPATPQLALALPLPAAMPFTTWAPRYMPPDAATETHVQVDGAPVTVHMLFYRNQTNHKALISSTNRLAREKDPHHIVTASLRSEPVGGAAFGVRETHLSSATGDVLVWQWLRVGSHATANNYEGKLWQAWFKLTGQGDDGAAVLLATPLEGVDTASSASVNAAATAAARKRLHSLLQGQLPAMNAAIDLAARGK